MGLLMTFVVEPIMGGINTGLNNALTGMGSSSKVVLGIVLGGMMAIDMGGPFNKAAYVFGTAAIAAGNYDIMAASDPLHVLPSCIVGSAAAGAISMAFDCTLMAPHGGIFVFPVVGNAVMYLVALVVGTVISAVLLGLLKKKAA